VSLAGGQREKVVRLFAIRFGLKELASLFRLLDDDLNGVALRSVNVEFGVFAFDEVNCFGLSKSLGSTRAILTSDFDDALVSFVMDGTCYPIACGHSGRPPVLRWVRAIEALAI